MLKMIELPNFSRVAAGANIINEIAPGPTFHSIFYSVTAAAGLDVTDIEKVEVYLEGKIIQRFSSLQNLLDHNTYYGHAGDSVGAAEIVFGLHFFRAEFEERWKRLGGIGTLDVTRMHVEIKAAAAAPADIAIEAHANIDTIAQPVGAFFRVTEYPTAADAGRNELDKLPKHGLMSAMHFIKSDVTDVDIEADQSTLIRGTKSALELRAKNASPKVRVPVTARMTHVDFCPDGDLGNAINLNAFREFRVQFDATAAGALTIVTETLDTLVEKS